MENTPSCPATPERLSHGDVVGDRGSITTASHMNGATTGGGGGGINIGGGGGVLGGGSSGNNGNGGTGTRLPTRRPQTQISPSIEQKSILPPQVLSLTIHKDSNGYGMKVSGDNPVYVESVKTGGAAQKAGLVAGDMILKVNGAEVRYEKHTTVVQLIKSHLIVELTVQRSQKMQRPTSVGIGPSTPLPQRDRVTAPQPVDNAKRREMEYSKMKTLRLMLEQERKNLDNLQSGSGATNRQDRARAEATIRKLQEQLRQVCGEDPSIHFLTSPPPGPPPTIIIPPVHHLATTPQPQHSSPAFLSRFPRSLSSLSLGTRKKPDKEIPSPLSNIAQPSPDLLSAPIPSHHHQQQQQQQQMLLNATPMKKKFAGSERNLKDDTPPPLPQRNPPRKVIYQPDESNHHLQSTDWRRNIPVSDLDHTMAAQQQHQLHHQQQQQQQSPKPNLPSTPPITGSNQSGSGIKTSSAKKRPKTKTKALSDPKMSTQMFLQMEKEHGGSLDGTDSLTPPPLPPRQPGMMEENQNLINSNKMIASSNNSMATSCPNNQMISSGSGLGGSTNSLRPQPNSVDSLMNYPLVATCTAVRDNMSAAFPLSQRPNIVQQLQQHQQHLHHLHHNLSSASTHSSASVNKSTALGQTPQHMNHMTKHRRVVSSPEHMHPRHERQLDRHNKSSSGSWELIERDNEPTPPGTPPPPYLLPLTTQSQTVHSEETEKAIAEQTALVLGSPNSASPHPPTEILAAQANTTQKEIISMEDEETSDQECIVDEHGPFNYLARLLKSENTVYLAVFLNYVLSNSDPAPLLFYLITELYKEGTVKDMRKWAYEIHSTFLVPFAPLLWFNVDETLAREVDNVLQNEHDKVEILKKVFWKSRKKAKEKINEQLRDFQQKRIAGLGTMYGPTDQQLCAAKGDKPKEQKIFEETLLPKLQNLVDELEIEMQFVTPKKLALSSALSTVLHRIFITRSNPGSPIDQVHHFVSREKSFKSRLMGKNRKMVVLGHPLVLRQYYEVTHCNHCQTIIWGVSPQGYHCTDCKLNIHRLCSKVLEESCPGPVPQKRKEQHTDNKISKFMGKIRPTHHFIQNERARRMDEESGMDDSVSNDRPHSTTSVVRQPSDRRPDSVSTPISLGGTVSHNQSDLITSQSIDTDSGAIDTEPDSKKDRSKSKSAPVSVNRSESYKERLSQKRNRNNRRKTSDPSLSKTNDEQSELGLSNANYTASCSSSSLSSTSLGSPSTSLEQVAGPGVAHTNISGPMTTATGTVPTPRQWVDSEDDEPDLTEADWSSNVAVEILGTLTDAEKKRQEIINEIYQTERNHVRTLKLLDRIFMRPLLESGTLPSEHLQLLFPPGLLSLKDIHSSFEYKLKQRRTEDSHIVRTIGDLLIDMFEGKSCDDLREYAAQVCAYQQIALEALKEKRRKDENLQRLLAKAEAHKSCRRLQLKDLLPTVLQRLTKYPLLFENLVNISKSVSPDNCNELDAIQRALDSSKRILVYVNQAVKTAEDAHKLQTIQRKLDKSSIDKDLNELRNLDITQYKLVYDGHLKIKKNPSVQLHGLLFENMIVLLQKQDDKYFLKNFPHTSAGGGEGFISPITHFDQQTLVRQSAVDKNTFFLIITKTSQMLELKAPSSSECKTWFKHISDAAEQYKVRSKSSHDVVEDPASATLPHSNTKESLESTPERTSALYSNNNASAEAVTVTTSIQQPIDHQSSTVVSGTIANGRTNLDNSAALDIQKDGNKFESNNNTNQDVGGDETEQKNRHSLASVARDDTKRDINSVLYSNNSNDTRTLMTQCPLLEPSEIHISISPAHTAEPVITPTERLRRLDDEIRGQLSEKQRIICDMFRVPHEHFSAIADIASQPEAPKDTSDIVLAAFAHVQSLTEVLTEYMKITPEQEISAVSTAVCDQCHHRSLRSLSPLPSSIASTNTGTTVIRNSSPQQNVREPSEDTIIQEDDGYCQIDELRLPSIGSMLGNAPVPTAKAPAAAGDTEICSSVPTTAKTTTNTSSELVKRQSTISADSIPEESEQDITAAADATVLDSKPRATTDKDEAAGTQEIPTINDQQQSKTSDDSSNSEHIEVNDTYDSTTSLPKPLPDNSKIISFESQLAADTVGNGELCGPNRFSHAHSLEPAVPCHILSGIVTALSSQISLLLPKISERDIERERLRRENQHLRELLNSMHERQRVEEDKETPDNTKSAEKPQGTCDSSPSPDRQ